MHFVKQHRQRLELLLMLLLGLICGSCLSKLLQVARVEFYDLYASNSSQHLTADTASKSDNSLMHPNANNNNNKATQRILCIVTLKPKGKRQQDIARTWGKRCHKLLFIRAHSGKPKLSIVGLAKSRTDSSSWARTRANLQFVHNRYHTKYDWFLMVTDETYVIMENLQHLLIDYGPEIPIYFDSFSWLHTRQGSLSGAGGNVFSREALRRFVTRAHDNSSICSNHNYGIRHVEIARCFRNVGVVAGKSRDEHGLPLFVNNMSNITEGCCSKSAISFQCVDSSCFYQMEYIIYRLRAFGLS
ncbi:glycoprotein-N-acetylgalactosamine 3-beta-galactosyltransferase 1-like [Drosophila montana]|uniref:glycoprotein-N-acetylgalactosamine 3-beta-galactosyltransferase 1-like n=1 Tax=Drosophila montana TaxID=40370 RepID=UPI00313C0FF7